MNDNIRYILSNVDATKFVSPRGAWTSNPMDALVFHRREDAASDRADIDWDEEIKIKRLNIKTGGVR